MGRFVAVACLAMCGPAVASPEACADANKPEANEPVCVTHVKWAMKQGYWDHKDWYTKYGVKDDKASFADFQCALWSMKDGGKDNGESHGCKRPCSSTLSACDAPHALLGKGVAVSATVAEGGDDGSSSWSTTQIVLAVLGGLGLLASIGFLVFRLTSKGPSKTKKRVARPPRVPRLAEEPEPPAAEVDTAPLMTPTYIAAEPPAVYTPSVYYQNPMQEVTPRPQSFVYAPPQQMYAAPEPMYAAGSYALPAASGAYPLQMTASPVAYYSPQ